MASNLKHNLRVFSGHGRVSASRAVGASEEAGVTKKARHGCLEYGSIWVFPKIVVPQNGWFIIWKTLLKWMTWGYHHLRKHPFVNLLSHQDGWKKLRDHALLASEGTFHLSLGMARGPGLFRSEQRVDLLKDRVHSHLPRRMPAEKDGQQRTMGTFQRKLRKCQVKGIQLD